MNFLGNKWRNVMLPVVTINVLWIVSILMVKAMYKISISVV